MRLRRERPDLAVAPGEQLLAWASDAEGDLVGGTRDALYFSAADRSSIRLPWEQVEAADWDLETSTLTVSEVGTWGLPTPEHRFTLDEPGRLLELVRERVTASVVLQRHVGVRGSKGVRVIARRAPSRHGDIAWLLQYDAGIDPADPVVQAAADEALVAAQGEVTPG